MKRMFKAINKVSFRSLPIVIAMCCAHLLDAQTAVPRASTMGACSPIVFGSRNVIDCGALSAHDAGVLAEILNEAHASSKSLIEIKELVERALDPNRTTTTYMPDGESITKNETGGTTEVMDKGERDVFVQLIEFEKSHNWAALLSLVQTEEVKVPTWFTIDFFASEAYMRACKLDEASQSLNRFISEVAHVGNYSEMLKIAKEARSKMDADRDAMRSNCSNYGAPLKP
jgi:hypothetical protein